MALNQPLGPWLHRKSPVPHPTPIYLWRRKRSATFSFPLSPDVSPADISYSATPTTQRPLYTPPVEFRLSICPLGLFAQKVVPFTCCARDKNLAICSRSTRLVAHNCVCSGIKKKKLSFLSPSSEPRQPLWFHLQDRRLGIVVKLCLGSLLLGEPCKFILGERDPGFVCQLTLNPLFHQSAQIAHAHHTTRIKPRWSTLSWWKH